MVSDGTMDGEGEDGEKGWIEGGRGDNMGGEGGGDQRREAGSVAV